LSEPEGRWFRATGPRVVDRAGPRLRLAWRCGSTADIFDAQGNDVGSFGSTGTGAGQMQAVQGVAVNGTRAIFVAEYGNNQVQKFAIVGPWPAPEATPEP
jgi:hypothetical protein